MGSWIVVGIQIALSVLTLLIAVLGFLWARAGARDGREARRLVEGLSSLMRSFHGPGYPGPSAVVTEAPSPEPAPVAQPLPQPARALPVLREAQPATVRPQRASMLPPVNPATMTEAEREKKLTVAMVLPNATAEGDRESAEEMTRVMRADERPEVEPEVKHRRAGLYSIVKLDPEPFAKPGEEPAPITPTQPTGRGK